MDYFELEILMGQSFQTQLGFSQSRPPWYRRKKKKKVPDKAQEWLHDGWTSGWLVGRGRCSLHKNASFGQNNFVHTALLKKQQILKCWNSNWDDWSGNASLSVPRSKRNSIRGIRNPKLGRALKIPHWPRYAMAFLVDVLMFCQGLEWFGSRLPFLNVISVGDFPRFAIQRLMSQAFSLISDQPQLEHRVRNLLWASCLFPID